MNNRLRSVRYDGKRISQFQLGRLTGIAQAKLSMIECNLIEPTAEEKKKLAQALKVTVEEIFQEAEHDVSASKNQ